ncbi:MAG TPA: protein kinase [Solirubrobacteraceae bacterium]
MASDEIAGRYRLEGRLGFGGMSTVHLALDLRLERQVAVKLLAEHLADDPAFVSRFQREAQAAARLIHPNIVQVFDSGQDQRTGQYFIVMEYIEGQSCAEILRDDGWVEVADALPIIEQACEGLHYAHRHGVVHRDVKPGNLLRSTEREVKLADFGIAKATEQSSITQVGSVLGTAAYLAPEQARGEEAGPSADLYALGVVTYQMIAGRLPYEASSLTELALKQQQEEPPTLDTLVAAVSPELADAVAVSLALDPRDRYRTAAEMRRALHDGARGVAPDRSAATSGGATHATRVISSGGRGTKTAAAKRAPAAVATRRPRQGPPRAARAAPAGAAPARRRAGRGRLALLLLGLLALLLVVVAIVIASAPETTTVHLPKKIVYSDIQHATAALKQLISENTK